MSGGWVSDLHGALCVWMATPWCGSQVPTLRPIRLSLLLLLEIAKSLLRGSELLLGVISEQEKLVSSALQSIQAVLHYAERKQQASSKLRTAAYDVDEFLDELLISAVEDGGGRDNVGKEVLPILANLLECQMQKVGVRLNGIADDESDCCFSIGSRSGGDGMIVGSTLDWFLCGIMGRDWQGGWETNHDQPVGQPVGQQESQG
ncbi:hypothetical protein ACLOJK_024724 [Asimina triloba]